MNTFKQYVDKNIKINGVYHGSKNKFDSFEPSPYGIFFTSNKILALQYGTGLRYNMEKKPYILITANLLMYNPLYISTVDDLDLNGIAQQAFTKNYDGVIGKDVWDDGIIHSVYIVKDPKQITIVKTQKLIV